MRRDISYESALALQKSKAENFLPLLERVDAKGRERLLWLLDSLRKAETLRVTLFELVRARKRSSFDLYLLGGPIEPRIEAAKLELNALLPEMNDHLNRYRFSRGIRIFEHSLIGVEPSISPEETFRWECKGAEWLIELATNGSFDLPADILKFRNCRLEKCGKLFYGSMDRQGFCAPKCCQKFHSSKESFKKKRAAKVREARRRDRLAERDYFSRQGTKRFSRHKNAEHKRRMIQ